MALARPTKAHENCYAAKLRLLIFPFISMTVVMVSGAEISASSRFINSSLSSLGVTEGAYRWTWGTGANVDFLALYIGSKPEPKSVPSFPMSTLTLLVFVMGLLGAAKALRGRSGPPC